MKSIKQKFIQYTINEQKQLVISPTKQYKNILKSKQRNQEKKIQEVPFYNESVKAIVIPPVGASSKKTLLRDDIKPTVELVVND